jgi:hypothetical protein
MRHLHFLAALPLFLMACQTSNAGPGGTAGSGGGTTTDTSSSTGSQASFGHCTYTNKFSKMEECREYQGSAWTEADVADDCKAQDGKLSDGACVYDKTLGTCVLGKDPEKTTLVIEPGDDATKCSALKIGCETFGGGKFEPAGPCTSDMTPSDPNATVFQPPEHICKDPVAGEPAGQSAGGKVCTWDMISGCTEPGRKFVDYASCGPVYTQRPYYPKAPPDPPKDPDPRLQDPKYVAELDWVKQQVEACACVCCHQSSVAPKGTGVWDIDAKGNWMDTFTPYGLAFAGGFMPSWPLGAYAPEDNNGFQRDTPDSPSTGMPSTDPARMAAFFKAELEHRGDSPDNYKAYDPQPEFFYDQATYQPAACDPGVGVAADGTVTWKGGSARYIYVLENGSKNPGVPPNLDRPAGTVWRLDVNWKKPALASGKVTFGKVADGAAQAIPADGSAPSLTANKTYYLYVLADVGVPITRCLFDYPAK